MTTFDKVLIVISILGGFSLVLHGIQVAYAVVPDLLKLRAKAWKFLAGTVATASFRRRAVSTGVEDIVNRTAFLFQRHLPKNWVKRARIKWVRDNKAAELRENQLILRVRPGSDSDDTMISALYSYFTGAMFPDTRDLLPEHVRSGIALAITRTALDATHPYLVDDFDQKFLSDETKFDQSVLGVYADCLRLHEFGFLTGPFIRELDQLAANARYSVERGRIPSHIVEILTHMLSFQVLTPMPDDSWYHTGPCTSYGFSLVSKPPQVRRGVEAYVERAKQLLERGVKRLYVVGREQEKNFLYSVVQELPRIRELRIKELFPLLRDYRGDPNGLCALVEVDAMLQQLDLSVRRSRATPSIAVSTPVTPQFASADIPESASVEEMTFAGIVENIIVQLSDYEGAWISLANFGGVLRDRLPDFSPERYGGRNLLAVLRQLPALEFDERGLGPAKSVFVRMREGTNGNQSPVAAPTGPPQDLNDLRDSILGIVEDNQDYSGWVFLGTLGNRIRHQLGDIDYSHYGFDSLYRFLRGDPRLEFEERGETSAKSIYVRTRDR